MKIMMFLIKYQNGYSCHNLLAQNQKLSLLKLVKTLSSEISELLTQRKLIRIEEERLAHLSSPSSI